MVWQSKLTTLFFEKLMFCNSYDRIKQQSEIKSLIKLQTY